MSDGGRIPEEAQWIPPPGPCRIAIVTGAEDFHRRFALTLQAKFPQAVVAWAKLRPSVQRGLRAAFAARASRAGLAAAERTLFRGEASPEGAAAAPLAVFDADDPAGPNAWLAGLRPTLVVVFKDGDRREALPSVEGVAMLQWCCGAGLGGREDIDRALRDQDLAGITSAVRAPEARLVLRETGAALAEDDTRAACFLRTAAAGAELVCAVVRDAAAGAAIWGRREPALARTTPERPGRGVGADGGDIAAGLRDGLVRRGLFAKLAF